MRNFFFQNCKNKKRIFFAELRNKKKREKIAEMRKIFISVDLNSNKHFEIDFFHKR